MAPNDYYLFKFVVIHIENIFAEATHKPALGTSYGLAIKFYNKQQYDK